MRLYATLRRFLAEDVAGKPVYLEVVEGTTLAQLLLERIGIPADELKMAMVNGLRREMGYVIQDGDRVGAFPPIGGG